MKIVLFSAILVCFSFHFCNGAEICIFAQSNRSVKGILGRSHAFIGFRSDSDIKLNREFQMSAFQAGSVPRNTDTEFTPEEARASGYKQVRMCMVVDDQALERLQKFYKEFLEKKRNFRLLHYNCVNYAADAWRAATLTEVPFSILKETPAANYATPDRIIDGVENLKIGTRRLVSDNTVVQVNLPSRDDLPELQLSADRGFQIQKGQRSLFGRIVDPMVSGPLNLYYRYGKGVVRADN